MASKAKPQTSDPGANHGVSGPCSGTYDFSGQDPYEEVQSEGVADAPELAPDKGGWGLTIKDTSNPKNGSGGKCRVIDPSKVKGINP